MLRTLCRFLVLAAALAMAGCNICNVTHHGEETWQFTGLVDRIYTPGAVIPGAAMFRYEVRFSFDQKDADPASRSARYRYTQATLEVFDENGGLFSVDDRDGAIELADTDGADQLRSTSLASGSMSGGLPNAAAARKLFIELTGKQDKLVVGPLSDDIDSVLPVMLDFENFDLRRMRVEFGSDSSFIEGDIREFACI